MACQIQQRSRVRAAADAIGSIEGVLGISVIDPNVGESERWRLEATLEGGGVPSAVLAQLAVHGLELGPSQPQGDHWEFVAFLDPQPTLE